MNNTTLLDDLFWVISVMWYRRFWLVLPIIVGVPLSVAIATIIPKSYEATSIVIFEASGEDNPLSRNTQQQQLISQFRIAEQIVSLEAWLKSDHVLTGIIEEILQVDLSARPKLRETELKKYRQNLSLTPLGNNTLEFRFKDSSPENLGSKLEIIMVRFLDGLERPDQDTFSGRQFLLKTSYEKLVQLENSFAALKKTNLSQTDVDQKKIGIEELKAELKVKLDNLNQINIKLEEEAKVSARQPGQLNQDIPESRNKTADQQITISNSVTKTNENNDINPLQLQKDALVTRIERIRTDITELEEEVSEYVRNDKQLLKLSNDIAKQKEVYQSYEKRFTIDSSARNSGIFGLLENVVVVGRPKDPTFATSRRIKYVIIGAIFSIAAGFGLALFVEFTDKRIRDPKVIEDVLLAPIIATLPSQ